VHFQQMCAKYSRGKFDLICLPTKYRCTKYMMYKNVFKRNRCSITTFQKIFFVSISEFWSVIVSCSWSCCVAEVCRNTVEVISQSATCILLLFRSTTYNFLLFLKDISNQFELSADNNLLLHMLKNICR